MKIQELIKLAYIYVSKENKRPNAILVPSKYYFELNQELENNNDKMIHKVDNRVKKINTPYGNLRVIKTNEFEKPVVCLLPEWCLD